MTELEAFAVELSHEAAHTALPFFRGEFAQENKAGPGAFDPVTEADRAAEAAIRRLIAARYPEHGVIGEEYGEDRPDADHVWVLDPIDGTRAFIAGLPLWTTLIALRHEGAPVIGAIGQPYLARSSSAVRPAPACCATRARRRSRPAPVRPCQTP